MFPPCKHAASTVCEAGRDSSARSYRGREPEGTPAVSWYNARWEHTRTWRCDPFCGMGRNPVAANLRAPGQLLQHVTAAFRNKPLAKKNCCCQEDAVQSNFQHRFQMAQGSSGFPAAAQHLNRRELLFDLRCARERCRHKTDLTQTSKSEQAWRTGFPVLHAEPKEETELHGRLSGR